MKKKFFTSFIALIIVSTMVYTNNVNAFFNDQSIPELKEDLENENLITAIKEEKIDEKINLDSKDYTNVIVEFKLEPAKIAVTEKKRNLTEKAFQNEIDKAHQDFSKFITKLKKQRNNNEMKIVHKYSYAYVGVSMKIRSNEIPKLFDSNLVHAVHKDEEINISPTTNEFISAPTTGYVMESNAQINAHLLHEENIKGKGIRVGVLDTGIDYNHPDLKDSYKGYRRIEGVDPSKLQPTAVRGWDFVDNDADPMETTYQNWLDSNAPEYNPHGNSYYTFHGTHVSGTIAGNPKNNNGQGITGVAPEVDLYSYRVLGPYGSGAISGIVAAIEKAIYDDMDVINLSLGGSADPTNPTTIAINNANIHGLTTVISAGNSGPTTDTIGSPGNSSYAITVGASTYEQKQEKFKLTANNKAYDDLKIWGYPIGKPFENLLDTEVSYEVFDLGYESEFENIDLTNKIAVIKRGELAFITKAANAKKAGAEAIIIYNNLPGEIDAYIGVSDITLPIFLLSKESGEDLVKNTVNKNLVISQIESLIIEGDELASFSSRGPIWLSPEIKPEVVAPGVRVYSSFPAYISNPSNPNDYSKAYNSINGTSMSAPHVTGVVALIMQHHPDLTPAEIKANLMNTATPMNGNYSVHEIGAGRVDAYKAVHTKTKFQATSYAIHEETTSDNSEANFKLVPYDTSSVIYDSQYKNDSVLRSSKKISITNNSKEDQTFDVEVAFNTNLVERPDPIKNNISVKVSSQIEVKKNRSKNLNTRIIAPKNADIGIYEGYYIFTNVNNADEVYKMPFSFEVKNVGINSFSAPLPLLSSVCRQNYFASPIHFKFASPMKEIQVIVQDTKSEKKLGLLSYSSRSGEKGGIPLEDDVFLPDVNYGFNNSGYMYEATFDDNGNFTTKARIAMPEGSYNLILRTVDTSDKVFTKTFEGYHINNTPPELQFFDENGNPIQNETIEVSKDMLKTVDVDGKEIKAYELKGKIYDPYIETLKAQGNDYYSQTRTLIEVYELNDNNFVSPFPKYFNSSSEEGILSFYIEEKDIFSTDYSYSVMFKPISNYGCATGDNVRSIAFTTPNTPYLEKTFSKEVMYPTETNVMKVRLNNVDKFLGGEFIVTTGTPTNNPFKIVNFDFSDEFKAYATENNLKLNKSKLHLNDESIKFTGNIKNKDFKGFSGDLDFLDITVVSKEKTYLNAFYRDYNPILISNFKYNSSGEVDEKAGYSLFTAYTRLNSNKAEISSYYSAEAFAMPEYRNYDFTELGIKIYTEKDDKKYRAKLAKNSTFKLEIPNAKHEYYDVIFDIPGHLTRKSTVLPTYDNFGEIISLSTSLPTYDIYNELIQSYAGDINKDEIIDINDIHQIAKCYGKTSFDKKCDLNQDGIVDDLDVRFIEKNFLKIGEFAKENAIAQKVRNGKTIDDYLKDMGLVSNK